MKQLREFVQWINSVREVEYLTEAKGHMDHPEDMVILGGLPGYMPLDNALVTMADTVKNPKKVTIKFDGYPALIFGSGPDGKFSILDKHMFNRGVNRPAIHSPQEFAQYEASRGEKGRTELVDIIGKIWSSLEKSYSGSGWYMGDLMFANKLEDNDGVYQFRPNPNGILYRVDVDSQLGKYLAGKTAGIAVHRYLDPDAQNTEDKVTWLSNLGNLKPTGDVAILPVSMPVAPKIQLNKGLQSKAQGALASQGAIDDFISNAPQNSAAFSNIFTVYLNNKIVSGNLKNLYTDFMPWIESRLENQLAGKKISQKMHDSLLGYIKDNANVVKQLFKNWIDVYNYKMDIVRQMETASERSPIRGYLQSGKQSQEGFVYGGLKFVDRQGFSAQNLAAKSTVNEDTSGMKYLVIYPGGFHPFHLGHASVYKHLAKKFPGADVYVAATDSTTERPFNFDDKKFLASQNGVPPDNFVQVKSPYVAKEITAGYDPNNTIVVYAVSEKDADRISFKPKKDGSPSYFQPYSDGVEEPMAKHGYIYVVPKLDFKVAGKTVDSASKIRAMYTSGDDKLRKQIVRDLYPGAKSPAKVKDILDDVLGGINEADNPNYFGGSSMSAIPGTPSDLMPGPSQEEVEEYHKQMADLRRFMGRR